MILARHGGWGGYRLGRSRHGAAAFGIGKGALMAGSDLEQETREALLKAIGQKASNASFSQLEQLAHAFALTMGASRSRLPGLQVVSQ